jgi:hypothetical protein
LDAAGAHFSWALDFWEAQFGLGLGLLGRESLHGVGLGPNLVKGPVNGQSPIDLDFSLFSSFSSFSPHTQISIHGTKVSLDIFFYFFLQPLTGLMFLDHVDWSFLALTRAYLQFFSHLSFLLCSSSSSFLPLRLSFIISSASLLIKTAGTEMRASFGFRVNSSKAATTSVRLGRERRDQ